MNSTLDSRRFPTSCLLSIHDPYFANIQVDWWLLGTAFGNYGVQIRPQVGFYTGIPPINFQLSPLSDGRQRRCDGYLGWYDHTVSLSEERSWRGFILRLR